MTVIRVRLVPPCCVRVYKKISDVFELKPEFINQGKGKAGLAVAKEVRAPEEQVIYISVLYETVAGLYLC